MGLGEVNPPTLKEEWLKSSVCVYLLPFLSALLEAWSQVDHLMTTQVTHVHGQYPRLLSLHPPAGEALGLVQPCWPLTLCCSCQDECHPPAKTYNHAIMATGLH